MRSSSDEDEEVLEYSEGGAPTVGEALQDRFSADQVFQRIIAAADEEITSRARELFFSGVAAGFAISITFLLYASMSAETDSKVIGSLLYPLGFIYIIIGGYQLYTENTLPPVALTIERLASLPALFRHWTIVLVGNFVGGAVGAIVLRWGGVFSPEAMTEAISIAQKGAFETGWWDLFFKALFAGLIVAGVVWVGFAARDTISRLVVVYLAFLAIPNGNLFHVVVSFTEALFLIFHDQTAVLPVMVWFVLPVLLGNTIGGVVLVTLINYFQTSDHRLESARFEGIDRRLSIGEWLFGRLVGRSYVPILNTTAERADGERFRIMVPLSNPREESRLFDLACAVAAKRENAVVHAVHIVQTPGLGPGTERRRRISSVSRKQLEPLEEIADDHGVGFQSSTVVTHRSFEEVFNYARRIEPDLVVMGWGENRLWSSARAERPLTELTNQLPCDFLVVKDRQLDASRILLPTAGGPDSDLSAEIAGALQSTTDATVSLLHVVDGPDEQVDGEQFLTKWATDHGLEDATTIVDDSGDIEATISQEAQDHTLLLLGATEKGMLSRLLSDSLHMDVIDDVDCSVGIAERPNDRPLFQRLFGRGRRETGPSQPSGDERTPAEDERTPAEDERIDGSTGEVVDSAVSADEEADSDVFTDEEASTGESPEDTADEETTK